MESFQREMTFRWACVERKSSGREETSQVLRVTCCKQFKTNSHVIIGLVYFLLQQADFQKSEDAKSMNKHVTERPNITQVK